MTQPTTERELLERVRACIERARRENPRVGFRRMVEMGLIDEDGRLLWESSEVSMAATKTVERTG